MKTPRARVVKSWRASYAAPIALRAGERLRLSGRSTLWEGHRWLWAANDAGAEGWVPDDLPDAQSGTARRDYSARELNCEIGEEVLLRRQSHGWAWCQNARGEQGWVPLTCLRWP